jgi:hypothetical protein
VRVRWYREISHSGPNLFIWDPGDNLVSASRTGIVGSNA